jgi:hypothetical protein
MEVELNMNDLRWNEVSANTSARLKAGRHGRRRIPTVQAPRAIGCPAQDSAEAAHKLRRTGERLVSSSQRGLWPEELPLLPK